MWHTWMCIHTHTHTGILLRHKKEWNSATCSNIDRLGGHYESETSQTE